MDTIIDRDYLAEMHRILELRFDESELKAFCYNSGIVNYDNLQGAGKADKARELVGYCERNGKLADLVAAGKRLRPDILWRDPPTAIVADPSKVPPPAIGAPSHNPYWHRKEIRDPACFFGRSREIQGALSVLPNSQCISLVGPRHIGKTSLLHYISNPLVLENSRYRS